MQDALHYAQEHADDFRAELRELLRIPSVSTDPAYKEKMIEAAEWLRDKLMAIGFSVEVVTLGEQHPIVYAEHLQAGDDAPTVLVYGHYDVQPAVMEDGWDSDPFEPIEKDGFLYARGATDDKGQFYAHIKAAEAILKASGTLPVNLKFIIEGEEEAGGEAISQYLPQHTNRLAADVVVISDTSMATIDQPVIINGLRGGIILQVTITGPKQDLHSGMFGGTVHNPAQALVEILAQLHDVDGRVTVPGFYDDVVELSEAEREIMAADPYPDEMLLENTGAPQPYGEAGYTTNERIGARPTLEITGMASGYYGEGFKSIVPHKAIAKISCRLVAQQDPQKIAQLLEQHIHKLTPPTVRASITVRGGSHAVLVDVDNPMMAAAIRAYEKGWGAKPIFKREGGSIPIVTDFQRLLGAPVVLMGFGLNSDGLHGPNEHFSIEMFHRGIDTAIHFFYEVAR